MKQLMLILALLSGTYFAKTQTPFPEFGKTNPSYFDVQGSFNHFFNQAENESSRLKKKFARWEYFYANRVDRTGHIPTKTLWEEWKKLSEQSGSSKNYSDWTEIGPRTVPYNHPQNQSGGIGRIDCITFHPTNENIYWIGTPTGGLWKTYDDGENWVCLTDNLPTLGVSDLKVHPENHDLLFMATGTRDTWWETYSVGILKSTDGGYNWEETGLSFDILQGNQVNEILINPENPDIMITATSIGIFRSEDGSETWERITYTWVKDIAFKPYDYSVIYAATFNNTGGAKFLISEDGGLSFTNNTSVGFNSSQVNRICIATTEANAEIIYLLCSSINNNMYGFYKSIDGGDSWTEPINDPLLNLIGYEVNGHDTGGFGYYMMGLAVSPENENELYAGGANVWKSTDGGQSWDNSADWLGRQGIDYVHADQHMLTYQPVGGAIFSGCDGGIYKKEAGSNDWTDKSETLGILQIYKIGLFYADESKALLGPQDNGIISISENSIEEIWLAEAGDNFFDQSNPDNIFVSGYGLGLCKSTDGGDHIYQIHPFGEEKLVFNPPFIKHATEDIIYCAFNDVYKSHNWGNTWTKIMDNPSSNPRILSLEVAPTDPNVLYAAHGKKIWRTLNEGELWTEITNGIYHSYSNISDITISDQNPLHVWVTLAGYNPQYKIYESIDGGDSWTNITHNLPNIPVNCITHQSNTESAIYVGTDLGVFYFNNDLDEWIYFSEGLPNVIVNELEINPLNQKIVAGTFGRGLWESNLMDATILSVSEKTDNQIKVFPNPNSGIMQIELNEDPKSEITVLLYDTKGNELWNNKISGHNKSIKLQLPHVPRGYYFLHVNYNNKLHSVKIEIVK